MLLVFQGQPASFLTNEQSVTKARCFRGDCQYFLPATVKQSHFLPVNKYCYWLPSLTSNNARAGCKRQLTADVKSLADNRYQCFLSVAGHSAFLS